MTKIDIFSGFLGAGKTTLIKKLLGEAYAGEKLVLIENEFGEIGIDGGFLQDAGIEITEMNSGCICCSLVGDFGKALAKVLDEYAPDRILIEPSGVGKLSDIIRAVQGVANENVVLNGFTTVADVQKCKMYMKNFGEFFNDQICHAGCIVLSHTQDASEEKIAQTVELLRTQNPTATIVTTPWDKLDGAQLLCAMERRDTIEEELARLANEAEHHHHHHHHHDGEECDDENCACHHHEHGEHHHHHHDGEECDDESCACHHHEHEEHHHHHHHHHDGEECDDENCACHHHEHEEHHHHHHHHHDGEECDDENCACHHHGHGEHHHHHADEVFASWGVETTKKFTKDELQAILERLPEEKEFGVILRAKGIVECACGTWLHFDYIPGKADVRVGSAGVIGRICVIGANLNRHAVADLFGVKEA
ncbi:MAG: GTP-binding protein [Clostridia bacterium]|nr:GTP-binding protein [Clostridia bacterium]